MMPLVLYVDGVASNAADISDDLPRAVIISLFSWRRANPDDVLPGNNKYGWWGDSFAEQTNDRIGSRLWLLSRSTLSAETVAKATEYAKEALQWLIDDGAVSALDVLAERQNPNRLAVQITITRGDATALNIRFADIWSFINAL